MERRGLRPGFVVGALAGLGIAGTTLWAITTIQERWSPPALEAPPALPVVFSRGTVPPQLAWFFIQYPYLSSDLRITAKNQHVYVIEDQGRNRRYVVTLSQRLRRVEIYGAGGSGEVTIHVHRPGEKRTVVMSRGRVVAEQEINEGNVWMWRSPLWNDQHLKIYSQADRWLDSPFKRYSCAGFVHRYLKDAGVAVPIRDAWDMARLPYLRVPVEELEPGDIIALKAASPEHRRYWGHSVTHVGVYIGHGKYIHAATASRRARRSFIKLGEIDDIRSRIAVILRPPDLL